MKKAIAIAAALAATPVAAQTEVCDTLAVLSEETAMNRMAGVQLYEMIVAAQQHPWADQEQEDVIIQIMSAIYASNLSPADAYILTYGTCVNEMRNQ